MHILEIDNIIHDIVIGVTVARRLVHVGLGLGQGLQAVPGRRGWMVLAGNTWFGLRSLTPQSVPSLCGPPWLPRSSPLVPLLLLL